MLKSHYFWQKLQCGFLDHTTHITRSIDIGVSRAGSQLKNIGSGRRTVCSRMLSISQFVVLISTTNCEKDSLLGQTILPPEPITFFGKRVFFDSPFNADPVYNFNYQQGKQCFQRWNRCVRFKVVKFDSLGLETCWTTFVSMSMLKPSWFLLTSISQKRFIRFTWKLIYKEWLVGTLCTLIFK